MERGELCSPVPGRQCFIDAVKLVSVVTPGQEVLLAGSPGEIKGQKKGSHHIWAWWAAVYYILFLSSDTLQTMMGASKSIQSKVCLFTIAACKKKKGGGGVSIVTNT